MKRAIQLEHRASSSRSKHEGESSLGLCDRLDRTRDNSQRQLPTDHDYAVPTREYQTDQSSLKPADSGIMKWPTSAVCFGPPCGQSELLVCTERELRTGAGVGLENQGGALRADSPGV